LATLGKLGLRERTLVLLDGVLGLRRGKLGGLIGKTAASMLACS
jgi:hypothetical protein